jgi:hypothetical protein
MSLHLNRQCQRADAHPPPVRWFRASVIPTKKRRETVADLKEAAAVAEAPYMDGPPARQRHSAKFLRKEPLSDVRLSSNPRRRGPAEAGRPSLQPRWCSGPRFQGSRTLARNLFLKEPARDPASFAGRPSHDPRWASGHALQGTSPVENTKFLCLARPAPDRRSRSRFKVGSRKARAPALRRSGCRSASPRPLPRSARSDI